MTVTRITFTADVGQVATAQNVSGSIRWHVYERILPGGTRIYVQREVNNVLEDEALFLPEGENPDIFFDPVVSQFILVYSLNENSWMIRIDENTAPTQQPVQSGTLIAHMRMSPSEDNVDQALGKRQLEVVISIPSVDAYNGPPSTPAAIAASPDPTKLNVRWRPTTEAFPFPAGFNVYFRRATDGAVIRMNENMIPFIGYDPVIYELEVPAAAGRYMVAQIAYAGRETTRTIEGRVRGGSGEIFSDGSELPTIIRSVMDRKLGEWREPGDLRFTIINVLNITIIFPETFPSHGPAEGFLSVFRTTTFTPILVADFPETFPSHGPAEGGAGRITQTGVGSIVVG